MTFINICFVGSGRVLVSVKRDFATEFKILKFVELEKTTVEQMWISELDELTMTMKKLLHPEEHFREIEARVWRLSFSLKYGKKMICRIQQSTIALFEA